MFLPYVLVLYVSTTAHACTCTEWATNYTSTNCKDPTRNPVIWYEGEIPNQLDTDAYCCIWTFNKYRRRLATINDPCDHSACTSAQITTTSSRSGTAYCSTPAERQFVAYLIGGILGGIAFILCCIFGCVLVCCILPEKKKKAAAAAAAAAAACHENNVGNNVTSAQGIAIAIPVKKRMSKV